MLVLTLLFAPAVAAQSLPDPTEPTTRSGRQSAELGEAPKWVLQSTLVAEERRVATINGESVRVGDSVAGARVVRIEPYAVRLRTVDGIIELSLSNGDPKQVAQGGPR